MNKQVDWQIGFQTWQLPMVLFKKLKTENLQITKKLMDFVTKFVNILTT